jgi:hypothetical protein
MRRCVVGSLIGAALVAAVFAASALAASPVNDNFSSAVKISGSSGTVTGSNVGATKETGEPNHAGNAGGASVWYTWTAPSSGQVTITTAGSSFDTLLGVYTGSSVDSLTEVASNDDANFPTDSTSSVTFNAVNKTVYAIAVDGFLGPTSGLHTGSVTLNWNLTSSGPSGPANDNFANAQKVSGSSGSTTGSNVGASKETGEPNHATNTGGASVWYSWTAPSSGDATVTTAGSSFDTLLGVYTGTSVSSLTEVASNDDANPPSVSTSSVAFSAVSGTTYMIAVDGFNGPVSGLHTGSVTLNWNESTAPGPGNDNFANATMLSGACGQITGSNLNATKEPGEPNHAGNSGGASVWYSWTAPASGSATFTTEGSSFDTELAVYTGSSVSSLTPVASNDDVNFPSDVTSSVTFNAVAGTTYRIAVDGYYGPSHGLHTGSIVLNFCGQNPPPPKCDQQPQFRWHYSANGTSGSWSETKKESCGTFSMGPQSMEGDLKVSPGTILKAGYDFKVASGTTVRITNAQVQFTARCVDGSTPSQGSFSVPLPDQTYTNVGSDWTPSGDQHSPLVYQGSISVPDVCSGGNVRLDKGGTFMATLSVD